MNCNKIKLKLALFLIDRPFKRRYMKYQDVTAFYIKEQVMLETFLPIPIICKQTLTISFCCKIISSLQQQPLFSTVNMYIYPQLVPSISLSINISRNIIKYVEFKIKTNTTTYPIHFIFCHGIIESTKFAFYFS